MLASVQRASIDAEDWKSAFLSLVSDRWDEIEKDYPMESITDISKSLFKNRSEIMGQAALTLIEKKFGHLLDQQYCECPSCNRRIKAKSEKVRREIDTVVGPVTLYRPYFYCIRPVPLVFIHWTTHWGFPTGKHSWISKNWKHG